MTLKDKETMTYECDKCKMTVFGGFKPTGFCFPQGGKDSHLCRPCYADFWEQFTEIEEDFIDKFLAG